MKCAYCNNQLNEKHWFNWGYNKYCSRRCVKRAKQKYDIRKK
jgi:hypothetical protein